MTDGNPSDTVTIEMRKSLAEELVEVLEFEVATADEYSSTEQVMEDSAQQIRSSLNE